MDQSLNKLESASEDPVGRVQREIAVLEAELEMIRKDLGAFELKINARLHREIARMRELAELYKSHKKEKKAKRLEQKKRGKNYVEPKQVQLKNKDREEGKALDLKEQKALKRLYKEAVVQIHPDKFIHAGEQDKIQRANAITAQLNGIYQRGDLEELINFYEEIVSGNAMHESSYHVEAIPDLNIRLESLLKKKGVIGKQLEQLKSSYAYNVLTTYENPLTFIDELHLQLLERIKQLEKRTKKLRRD